MSDTPTSSSYAANAMEAELEYIHARDKQIRHGTRKIAIALERLGWLTEQASLEEIALLISKHMPPRVSQSIIDLVSAQAEDEALWFVSPTAPEAYLQYALRRVHAAIEAENTITSEPMPPSVPAGWKLVPLIPTKDMIEASCKGPGMTMINNMLSAYQIRAGLIDEKAIKFRDDGKPAIQEAYEAMLAVAPEPKEKP